MPESPPIRCAHTRLVPLAELRPHDRNPNVHPPEQIRMLAKIITHQGWRSPITVSNRSGLVVTGHGRLAAAQLLGLESAPVDFQDFASDEDELAHLLADNAIADLAELDPAMEREIAEALSAVPEFDTEITGLTNEMFAELTAPALTQRTTTIANVREVIVECASESEQREIFEKLTTEGRKCRLSTF